MEKECSECLKILEISFFKKRNRKNNIYYYPYCFDCLKLKNKCYKITHKNIISLYEKNRYIRHRNRIKLNSIIYYINNKIKCLNYQKKYQSLHKDIININACRRKRYRKSFDSNYKIRTLISSSIYCALKKNNSSNKIIL